MGLWSPSESKKSQCIDWCIQMLQTCVNKHEYGTHIKFEVSLHFWPIWPTVGHWEVLVDWLSPIPYHLASIRRKFWNWSSYNIKRAFQQKWDLSLCFDDFYLCQICEINQIYINWKIEIAFWRHGRASSE